MLLLMACSPQPVEPLPDVCSPLSQQKGDSALIFEGESPKNLLVISIDTLRRDRIGRYDKDAITPFMDGFLEDSVVMDDFRSCSNWTYPSMSCLMVGQSMTNLGLDPIFPADSIVGLAEDQPTLATWLQEEGWQTSLVTSSGIFSPSYPNTNGFEEAVYLKWRDAGSVVDGALHTIRDLDPTQKWYFHVHFLDPHSPYDPPPEYQGDLAGRDLGIYDPRKGGMEQLKNDWDHLSKKQKEEQKAILNTLYRGQIQYLDHELQRFWEVLQQEGFLDNTLVLLVTDHGEQHFEHGALEHLQSLYPEENRGVAAFWSSSLEPLAWQGPVNHLDLSPTILETFGVPIPESIEGSVIGSAPEDRLRFASGLRQRRPVQSVDRFGIHLVFDWDQQPEMYDLRHDPGETVDLWSSSSKEATCMFDFLRPMIQKVDAEKAGGPPRLSAYR